MLLRLIHAFWRQGVLTSISAVLAGCSWLGPSVNVRGILAGLPEPMLGSYTFLNDMDNAQISITNRNRTLFCVGDLQKTSYSVGVWSLRFSPAKFKGQLRCDDGSIGQFVLQSNDSESQGLSGTGTGHIGSREFTFVAAKASLTPTDETQAGDDASKSWRRIDELHRRTSQLAGATAAQR